MSDSLMQLVHVAAFVWPVVDMLLESNSMKSRFHVINNQLNQKNLKFLTIFQIVLFHSSGFEQTLQFRDHVGCNIF